MNCAKFQENVGTIKGDGLFFHDPVEGREASGWILRVPEDVWWFGIKTTYLGDFLA